MLDPRPLRVSLRTQPRNVDADFAAELPELERMLTETCRQASLSSDDGLAFTAWAHVRLMGDEFAFLRQFGGKNSLSAYVAVVLKRLLAEFRDHHARGPLA